MKIEQIYTGCLAHGAYYIESHGEVAIIDPLREVQPYLEKVEKKDAKIKYVLDGFSDLQQSGKFKVTDFVQPTTML